MDFDAFDANDPESLSALSEEVDSALSASGFMSLTNLGLEPELLNKVFAASREFFSSDIEDLAHKTQNRTVQIMAVALDQANGQFLEQNKSPSRKVGELDNRGSHFYLAIYWADALAAQTNDSDVQAQFVTIAAELHDNEQRIINELNAAQGSAVDLGGYYHPDTNLVLAAMLPKRNVQRDRGSNRLTCISCKFDKPSKALTGNPRARTIQALSAPI